MSYPSPLARALEWSTCILGGDVLPGVATVECGVKRDIEKQKKKGDDGVTLKDQGYESAPVTITLVQWLEEHWTSWMAILPKIHPRTKGGVRTPLAIVHPEPNHKGVAQVYVEEIPPTVVGTGAEYGKWTITIKAWQWFPLAKPAKSKMKAPSNGGDLPPTATPPNTDAAIQNNAVF